MLILIECSACRGHDGNKHFIIRNMACVVIGALMMDGCSCSRVTPQVIDYVNG